MVNEVYSYFYRHFIFTFLIFYAMQPGNDAHTKRFNKILTELTQSHTVPQKYHKNLEDRLKITFQPVTKPAQRGRRPKAEEKEQKGELPSRIYRRHRAQEVYRKALKKGSCFFLVLVVSVPTARIQAKSIKALQAARCQFVLENRIRSVFEDWARIGEYCDNEGFITFLKGLPLSQGLLICPCLGNVD